MKKIILLFSILLIQFGCSNSSSSDETKKVSYPDCISSKIQDILQSPVQNPKANIKKYYYQNQYVYKINSFFADGKSPVYNDRCELICEDGGIDGSNTCVNWENATFIESVWIDPR
ncbi:DUF6970 domain-containing protein [Flavobacterium psychrophilum]|uniref:DUF6970 domain-containing protein n=1 Tax=Flavobacterium psychrophilum TaxID=96345 RepID=UPI000B7C3204|nr:hypothetical protein [Flavobacterium psychrophilum]SNB04839.1 conserved exported hypothetical protein [Flavobacterium psychrophilum]